VLIREKDRNLTVPNLATNRIGVCLELFLKEICCPSQTDFLEYY
jgi:hypothetical protein